MAEKLPWSVLSSREENATASGSYLLGLLTACVECTLGSLCSVLTTRPEFGSFLGSEEVGGEAGKAIGGLCTSPAHAEASLQSRSKRAAPLVQDRASLCGCSPFCGSWVGQCPRWSKSGCRGWGRDFCHPFIERDQRLRAQPLCLDVRGPRDALRSPALLR